MTKTAMSFARRKSKSHPHGRRGENRPRPTSGPSSVSLEPLTSYLEVRQQYLSPPLSTRKLRLRETREAASRLSADRNDLRLFGLPTIAWYLVGIRILGRTVIEATRDPQARFLAKAVAETLREHGHEVATVIDPFVGSGNVLYHLVKETNARRAIGVELDADISRLTIRNFDVMRRLRQLRGADIAIHTGDWSLCRTFLGEGSALVHLSPPWGDAFTVEGLDLRATHPPIMAILSELERTSGAGPLFAAVSTFPKVVPESIDEVLATYKSFTARRPSASSIASRIDYLLLQIR
jgi:hypothetical protein